MYVGQRKLGFSHRSIRVQELWGVEVLRGPRNVLVGTAFPRVWGWEVRQGFAVFLGQLCNPPGRGSAGSSHLSLIDGSALSLPLSVPLRLSYILLSSLLSCESGLESGPDLEK